MKAAMHMKTSMHTEGAPPSPPEAMRRCLKRFRAALHPFRVALNISREKVSHRHGCTHQQGHKARALLRRVHEQEAEAHDRRPPHVVVHVAHLHPTERQVRFAPATRLRLHDAEAGTALQSGHSN